MDETSFDRWTVRLSRLVTRRAAVGGLGAIAAPRLVSAKKRKRKRRKKKQVRFNDFGCVNVGDVCTTSDLREHVGAPNASGPVAGSIHSRLDAAR